MLTGDDRKIRWAIAFTSLLTLSSCATTRERPCTRGSQAAREDSTLPFNGTKQCTQKMGPDGKYVNDGIYKEWYANEKIAAIGNFKMGKKTGRWIEYDEQGNKISDKYFEDGKEIPRP